MYSEKSRKLKAYTCSNGKDRVLTSRRKVTPKRGLEMEKEEGIFRQEVPGYLMSGQGKFSVD